VEVGRIVDCQAASLRSAVGRLAKYLQISSEHKHWGDIVCFFFGKLVLFIRPLLHTCCWLVISPYRYFFQFDGLYIYYIYIMSIFLLLRDQLHDFMFSMVVMFTPNSWTSIWSNMNMIDIFPIYLAGKLMQTWGPKMDCFLVSRKGINLVKPVVPRFWSSNRTGPSAQCNSCDDGQLDACSWVAACHPRTCSKTHEGFQDVLTPIIYVYHTSIYIYIYILYLSGDEHTFPNYFSLHHRVLTHSHIRMEQLARCVADSVFA